MDYLEAGLLVVSGHEFLFSLLIIWSYLAVAPFVSKNRFIDCLFAKILSSSPFNPLMSIPYFSNSNLLQVKEFLSEVDKEKPKSNLLSLKRNKVKNVLFGLLIVLQYLHLKHLSVKLFPKCLNVYF